MSSETIEEKRRKNVIDNQNFLQSLQMFNARDDFKCTVDSVSTGPKLARKKWTRKEKIDPSEVRRSSRIRTMVRTDYNHPSTSDDENIVLSSDEPSSNEEAEDLSSAFVNNIDTDWQPARTEKIPKIKKIRPVRKTVSAGVKIFLPNIGLQASKVVSDEKSHQSYVSKKINVAISSSSDEEN